MERTGQKHGFISKLMTAWGLFFLTGLQFAAAAVAEADDAMPWVSPLQKVLDSISGPVAKILGVIAIIVAGLGIAFGEAGSGMKRMFQILMGLSIAFTAGSLVTSLFGVSSGSVF